MLEKYSEIDFENRCFSPEPHQREVAKYLHSLVADTPLVCPHGHVDPAMFASADYSFGTPSQLLLIPDHYVFRMLYSQGIQLEDLGVPRMDGGAVERDHRKIWQVFAEHFHLFRGTPTGMWLTAELHSVLGIEERLNSESAQRIYDQIAARLASPEFRPRALYDRFNIEVLCTTDAATDDLVYHQAIRDSGWHGRILPTFRPDAVVNIGASDWLVQMQRLGDVVGYEISSYETFIQALEERRTAFKAMGATATDHAVIEPYTCELPTAQAEAIFQSALLGKATGDDIRDFTGHMLMEFARMSVEDGLVMQLHCACYRNHNRAIFEQFGADNGADIPVATEFTRNLYSLLNRYGNDPRLSLILFTLNETVYSGELAPLAGHYPAVKLGPPWWFHDSWNGIQRYFEQVTETAGLHNTAGFNDDTRAFLSIPARHDVWRRVSADWVARLVVHHMVDLADAEEMILDLAYRLAKRAYRLG